MVPGAIALVAQLLRGLGTRQGEVDTVHMTVGQNLHILLDFKLHDGPRLQVFTHPHIYLLEVSIVLGIGGLDVLLH